MALSIVAFIIIELPPGDYVTRYVAEMQQDGYWFTDAEVAALRKHFGVDRPIYVRYFQWGGKLLRGDFGVSFSLYRPVSEVLAERVPLTAMLSLVTLFFTFGVAIPIGIYSALHQYSGTDYFLTFVGFIGLAIPNFLLALILMFFFHKYFGLSIGGLFSPEYMEAPLSAAKIMDLINHMWIPIIVIGTAGTANLIRIMRACLLDELRKQYVITARAKGMREGTLLFKYPVRVAINPIVSTIGWLLPSLISGETIVAIVLSLPTTGPILLKALLSQDVYLAGSIVMILGFLTIVGTAVSDILLVMIDPRIRYEK